MANLSISAVPDSNLLRVVALQMDLLDNRPLVSVRNVITGEVHSATPQSIFDSTVSVDRATVYAAAYLQGYSDRHFDAAIGSGIAHLVQNFRAQQIEEVRP